MKKLLRTQFACAALAVTLTFGTTLPTAAASDGVPSQESGVNASGANANPAFTPVTIDKVGTFELTYIQLLPQPEGNTVSFTITVRNDATTEMKLLDYYAMLKSKSGQVYTTRISAQDKDKKLIKAASTQELTYFAQVDESIQLEDLIVEIGKWQFDRPKFEHSLGKIEVPEGYSAKVPAGKGRVVSMGGTQINVAVTRFLTNVSDKNRMTTVYLQLENVGNRSAKIPEYQFAILTADGLTYPLDMKSEPQLLKPREALQWRLTGSIPVTVDPGEWQLVVTEQLGETKLSVPVSMFELAESTQTGEQTAERRMFSLKSGVYEASLNHISRVPWEERDMLLGDATIWNRGTNASSAPELSAYFLLDGNVKVPAELIQLSQSVGVQPNGSIPVQAIGKIPLNTSFKSVKLVLQEKEAEGKASDVLEFESKTVLKPITFYRAGESYKTNETGRNTKYSVAQVNRYYGSASDIFTVQLEVENLDKRPSDAASIVAYIAAGDGSTYPTKASEIKSKIAPNGKAMVEIWSDIPKDMDISRFNLIIGESVSQGKLTEGDAKPDGYVKPIAFWLPDEKPIVKNSLLNMDMYPYSLSIKNLDTTSKTDDYSLKFDIEVVKTKFAASNMEGHQLVVSIDDARGYPFYESSFSIRESLQSGGSGSGTLRPGKNQFRTTLPAADVDFWQKYGYWGGTLNVYDEFQGQRRLLGSQGIIFYSNVND